MKKSMVNMNVSSNLVAVHDDDVKLDLRRNYVKNRRRKVASNYGVYPLYRFALLMILFFFGVLRGATGVPVPDGDGCGGPTCCGCPDGGLRKVVSDWIAGGTLKNNVIEKYGTIEEWDTSLVTTLSSVFFSRNTFNADISKWDVSLVTTMGASKLKLK
jgi:hypothetical protein